MAEPFTRASLAGAFDLSALKQKAQSTDAGGATGAAVGSVGSPATKTPSQISGQVPVRSLVIDAGVENLRELLGLSNEVPVLVDFKTASVPGSAALTELLARLAIEAAGKFILARVDADKQPEILEAFQLRQGGVAVALLRGQPVPLISADLDETEINARLSRVYEVAAQQGITGLAVVSGEAAPAPAAALPPRHQKAFELIDAGEYDLAIAEYEAALREMPTDSLATAGLAQVKLLKRVEGIDFAAVLSSEPSVDDATALDSTLLKADACLASGHAEFGMNLLLDRFAVQFGDRDALRARLLEFFTILGDDSDVTAARKRLTSLMY
jgi:putative thioredoxin